MLDFRVDYSVPAEKSFLVRSNFLSHIFANMFAQCSSTTRDFLLRGAEGSCDVDKIGTAATGFSVSFPTFDDVMVMNIDDADLAVPAPKSLLSNNRSTTLPNITVDDVDDNLIDELEFLQETFQATDDGGEERGDNDMYFDLLSIEEKDYGVSATIPPRFCTSKMTRSSKNPTKASSPICTRSSTVEQIRSLETKLTKSMQRTNMSRAAIQDNMSSRPPHVSRSSFESHASTTSLTSVGSATIISSAPPAYPPETSNISPKRIASTAAFLMGKRSTITPALEESRKKLKMYMEQLDMTV